MADPTTGTGGSRRTFAPVVLLGLASGALAAYAGTKPWLSAQGRERLGDVVAAELAHVTSSPLSTGLAFVVLACWGVLLVTRGRFRRAVALLAVIAALGDVLTVALSPGRLGERLREEMRVETGTAPAGTTLTAWFWVAVVAAVLLLASTSLAVRFVRSWPEMGTRYDAPTGARTTVDVADDDQPTDNLDIWKALDEGRDPTA